MQKTTVLAVLWLSLSVLAFAGKKFTLAGTTVAPAARGEVEASLDKKNGNTKVKIKVEHLAPPANLNPPMTGYLIWFQQPGGTAESQGRLRIDKNLKASFETTTPWKTFDIVVTAESDATVKAPTGAVVLKGSVQQ
jgi:hypothetical protein